MKRKGGRKTQKEKKKEAKKRKIGQPEPNNYVGMLVTRLFTHSRYAKPTTFRSRINCIGKITITDDDHIGDRAQELCGNRGGRPGLPVHNKALWFQWT